MALICISQFKWRLRKKASQVLYLQFALRKRAIIEEFHDKQGQVCSLHFAAMLLLIHCDPIYEAMTESFTPIII